MALSAADLELLKTQWNARWIYPAGAPPNEFGVYRFRRKFDIASKPGKFVVHVSGDSRYQLFVNGQAVSWGPARGDLYHWRYETVDMAPYLKAGRNLVTATVWNDGPHAAVSQWSNRTAFLLQAADSEHQALVNTGTRGWKSIRNEAYAPIPVPTYQPTGYYAIGPMERYDAAKRPKPAVDSNLNPAGWVEAEAGRNASPRDQRDAPARWMLVPRAIPQMERTPQLFAKVRKADGVEPPPGWVNGGAALTVTANSKAVLLLDQGVLTTAFPYLHVAGGRDAVISLEYTEALFKETKPRRMKGNRNEFEGKEFTGYGDEVVADGSSFVWEPLYWRTFRYVRLTIQTDAEALTIGRIGSFYTGYPFQVKATFQSGVPLHDRIFETGWRTARLCAHETYMDCPYYEQLQYAGDTRIQAMISLYMTGDGRLMRNAIEQIDSSRTSEGATYSRAPSTLQQYIPPFSLWWIGMVHDYFWYVDDPAFVKSMLNGVRAILGFYANYVGGDGLLGAMPWWNYVDWVQAWQSGRPPSEAHVMPATIHMQYLLALEWAAGLENALGDRMLGERNEAQAKALKLAILRAFWTPEKRLFSENLAHSEFSQHANVLAVLGGVLQTQAEERDLMERVEPDKSLYKCSVYFRYYLDRAMVKAGLGGRYLDRLGTWEYMLSEGLSTWAEQDFAYTRSDCHAWGASPNVEFLRTVLGVDSAAPGFAKVRIQPHLGKLERVSGLVPHPKGLIRVEVTKVDGRPAVKCELPPGVELLKD